MSYVKINITTLFGGTNQLVVDNFNTDNFDIENYTVTLENVNADLDVDVPAEKYESSFSNSFLVQAGRKALFITSLPFYWFVIFKVILGTFSMWLFLFAVISSGILSATGNSWGILDKFAM